MCSFSPAWVTHSQNFRRLLRRWGIGGTNLDYLLTGVLPTSTVQRSWQDDESDQWGVSCLVTTGAGGRIPAVVVVPSSTNDCYLDQIDVIAYPASGIGNQAITNQPVSLFTPEGGYTPLSTITTTPQPGLVNVRNFILPTTVFLGGWNTVFQPPGFAPAVFILDAHYNPSITQFWPARFCTVLNDPNCAGSSDSTVPLGVITLAASSAFQIAKSTRIWSQQQPPMRVAAQQAMAVQLGVIPSVSYVLLCTFLFHEVNAEQL